MTFTQKETRLLTALAREQNQTGCKGPAHDLLRRQTYPDAPLAGPGSLAYSYEATPLTGILLKDCKDLQEMDDFLRNGERICDPEWPWSSPEEYRTRLEEARTEWTTRELAALRSS
jgi:hypothetical protein